MSKLIATFSGLVCFVWVFFWSWLMPGSTENSTAAHTEPSTSVSISDSAFNSSSAGIFSFHQSDATPVVPSDNLQLFQELAQHLGKNTERKLELNGHYSPTERNQTPHPNLGIARAKAIEKLLISAGAHEGQLVCTSTASQTLFLMDGRILGGVDFLFSEKNDAPKMEENLALSPDKKEAGSPITETHEKGLRQFFYDKEAYKLDPENREFLDSLRRAMRKKPNETVIISGYSQPKEEKDVPGNLAELRAKAVRRYLVDKGLRRRQIVVVSHPGSGSEESERRVELKVERD